MTNELMVNGVTSIVANNIHIFSIFLSTMTHFYFDHCKKSFKNSNKTAIV